MPERGNMCEGVSTFKDLLVGCQMHREQGKGTF